MLERAIGASTKIVALGLRPTRGFAAGNIICMKIKLTDRFLRSLTPPEAGRLEVSDTERRGLRFRLSASGKAVWMYEKRVKGGPKRKHTLGAWPRPVSLSEARARALEIEAEAGRGVDRIALAEAELRASKHLRDNILTVREVFEVYDRLHLSNLRTRDERLRQLEQSLAVHLDRSVLELSRKDIQKAVDDKAASGRKAYANRIRAALAAFTKWAWFPRALAMRPRQWASAAPDGR